MLSKPRHPLHAMLAIVAGAVVALLAGCERVDTAAQPTAEEIAIRTAPAEQVFRARSPASRSIWWCTAAKCFACGKARRAGSNGRACWLPNRIRFRPRASASR